MYKETISLCSDDRVEPINIVCGKNAEICYVKVGGLVTTVL
jgi:hypothetical protein